MENRSVPRIVEAEKLDGGIVITFDDGKSAVYPASLLHAILPSAEPVIDPDSDQ